MMIELISLGFAPVAAILSFLAGQWRHAEINLVTTGLPSLRFFKKPFGRDHNRTH
jgi:hypothetical protein